MFVQYQLKQNNTMARKSKQRQPRRQRNVITNFPRQVRAYTPVSPGRIVLKGAAEVFNGFQFLEISYAGFQTWSSQARGVLGPFIFFRVVNASVTMLVAGGTAGAGSITFNISNAVDTDATPVAILNDDYAGMATAAVQPMLRPPPAYWAGRSRPWFSATDPVAGLPTKDERIAGSISLYGSGGATGVTVIGWALVELDLEFHTLI